VVLQTKRNLLALVAMAALFPLAALGQGSKGTPKSKAAQKALPASAAAEKEIVKSFGSRSAPITMEVFSDFQCPA